MNSTCLGTRRKAGVTCSQWAGGGEREVQPGHGSHRLPWELPQGLPRGWLAGPHLSVQDHTATMWPEKPPVALLGHWANSLEIL